MYELLHELPYDIRLRLEGFAHTRKKKRLRLIGNQERSGKSQTFIELQSSAQCSL